GRSAAARGGSGGPGPLRARPARGGPDAGGRGRGGRTVPHRAAHRVGAGHGRGGSRTLRRLPRPAVGRAFRTGALRAPGGGPAVVGGPAGVGGDVRGRDHRGVVAAAPAGAVPGGGAAARGGGAPAGGVAVPGGSGGRGRAGRGVR